MKKFTVLVLLTCCSLIALSQPGDPGGGTDPDVPIGGIEILLGIGGMLGGRKLLKKRIKTK